MLKLKQNFILEVLRVCLEDSEFLTICSQNLKYEFLQTDSEKIVYKYILDYFSLHSSPPTLGIVSQNLPHSDEIISLLSQLKEVKVTVKSKELLPSLEDFVKKSKFVSLYDKITNLYNTNKSEQAYRLLAEESQNINSFSIKDKVYKRVFGDFTERISHRQTNQDSLLLEKTTLGIRELNDMFYGGPNKGTSVLWMASSGVGKSTALRWVGISNAREGKTVVHFQLEGSEQECLDAYDAGWAGITIPNIEFGDITDEKRKELEHTVDSIKAQGGEIFVYAFESFDSGTIEECREILLDIMKSHKVDLAIFDYAELLQTKKRYNSDESSERKRREDIANKLTNLAVELKITVHTATQSKDIDPSKLNNPDYCMTHSDISEFKGFLKPFSYFFTLNQTRDEYENEIMRIYVDKVRKFKIRKRVVKFYQARDVSRFYDAYRTRMEFGT